MLGYRLLVIGPLLFVGSIAIRARIGIQQWDFPACTHKQEDDISAYRRVACDALQFRDIRFGKVDRTKLRTVAQSWVEGRRLGILKPLTPAFLGDSIREGVKQQIRQAAGVLVCHLQDIGKLELQSGRPRRACEDILLAMQVSEVLKYSDPYAVALAGIEQRTSIKILDSVAPKLAPFDRGELAVRLEQLRKEQGSLDSMVRLMRQLYRQSKERRGEAVSEIQEVDQFLAVSQGSPDKGFDVFRDVPHTKLASAEDNVPLISTIRMATASQSAFLRRLDERIAIVRAKSVVENPEKTRLIASAP